jgi:hydrogenase maturation factor HypF (carbamoyltransferase family)
MEGFEGLWITAGATRTCSACAKNYGKVLQLKFGTETMRACPECAVALRELLIDALEDEGE